MANFYELTTVDGVSVMVNLETIGAIIETEDNFIAHVDGMALTFKKEDMMAALVASNTGFFKFNAAEPTDAEVTEMLESEVEDLVE